MPETDFEWHDEKNAANILKHKIDFEDAIEIFCGFTLEGADDRFDYGETRIIAYGEAHGHILAIVYTLRGDIRRIISARRARTDERHAYYAALAERPPDRSD